MLASTSSKGKETPNVFCFKFYECLKLNIESGLHQTYENVDIKRELAISIPSNGEDYICCI